MDQILRLVQDNQLAALLGPIGVELILTWISNKIIPYRGVIAPVVIKVCETIASVFRRMQDAGELPYEEKLKEKELQLRRDIAAYKAYKHMGAE